MDSSARSRSRAEIFAERWTPLILRELFAGARRFNDIRRGVPLISRSLLVQRLRELEDAGVLDEPAAGERPGAGVPADTAGEELRGRRRSARRLGPALGDRPVRPRATSTSAC